MRSVKKNKVLLISVLFLLPWLVTSGQTSFKYTATLNKIDSTGFYKINIGPDILRKSKDDLSDIRLADPAGNFVAYVTESSLPIVEKQRFLIFPQVPAQLKTDTGTAFIVKNLQNRPISNLWVKLKNTAVRRFVNLLGSDDLKKWYAIEEDIPLQEAVSNNDGTYLQSLSFPATNYRYLKLLIKDKNKAPVKFLAAGGYFAKSDSIFYWPISSYRLTRTDSDNSSRIVIKLNDKYQVDLVRLYISNPKYYKRNIAIYELDQQGKSLISTSELSSEKEGKIFISARTNILLLEIANGDNLPLKVNDIKVYQANRYIVSYLEKGKLYKLLTGDTIAKKPEYDLKFFTDSIRNIQPLGLEPIIKNNLYLSRPTSAKRDYSLLIWVAIVFSLLLLSLLTWRMAAEVKKNN